VNDPRIQAEFRNPLGLCERHAYLMLDPGDGLATAILYRAATLKVLELLSEVSDSPGPQASWCALPGRLPMANPAIPEPGTGCLVCCTEEKAKERYLQALLDGAEDGSLDGAVERTGRRVRPPRGQDGAASLSTTCL
jgi:hypothetical protein